MPSHAALAIQKILATGLVPAFVPAVDVAGDGHKVVNGGKMFLYVKVGVTGSGSTDVTIRTPRTVENLAVAEQVVNIVDSTEQVIGPFPPATFNNLTGADRGTVYVDYSVLTNVTVAALVLP